MATKLPDGWRVYTVRGAAEETECDWCGMPLYSGDRAILILDNYAVCGRTCGNRLTGRPLRPDPFRPREDGPVTVDAFVSPIHGGGR